jgi:hypothetical protein
MGDTIWVDVRGRPEDADLPPDSSLMLRLQDELEALAAKLGVPKLSDFYDYSVLEEQLDEILDEGRNDQDPDETAARLLPPRRGRGLTPPRVLQRCVRFAHIWRVIRASFDSGQTHQQAVGLPSSWRS